MKNLIYKLALGTAQLGLNYGINNREGKPSVEKALDILSVAWDSGIRMFDTAYGYGDAEEILGRFAAERGLKEEMKIVTKLKPDVATSDEITSSLKESLKRLGRKQVDGLLSHTPEDLRNKSTFSALTGLKKAGLTKNIGISLDDVAKDGSYAAGLKEIDYIQIPYNILDLRAEGVDFFRQAKDNGKTVFARSAFLQGLIFMTEEKIPAGLSKAAEYLKRLDRIISKYGLTRQEAALMFSLSNDLINYTVIGVDNADQLKEYVDLAKNVIITDECLSELRQEFAQVEEKIISPYLWQK